jgi:hypothetical protein
MTARFEGSFMIILLDFVHGIIIVNLSRGGQPENGTTEVNFTLIFME